MYTWQHNKVLEVIIELRAQCETANQQSITAKEPIIQFLKENPLRDTACRLRRKGLDMPWDSYWGWLSWFYRTLSHFVSFKNRNHLLQFESCLKSSSDRGAICIKLDLVESEKFSARRKYTRNHHSRVIT